MSVVRRRLFLDTIQRPYARNFQRDQLPGKPLCSRGVYLPSVPAHAEQTESMCANLIALRIAWDAAHCIDTRYLLKGWPRRAQLSLL
eukprot:1825489-Pleurochrysis_carterae.AAC.16